MDNNCNLFKHKVIKPVAWVGKSGTHYPYNDYQKEGTKRLPTDDHPYTVTYSKSQLFKCCSTCNCIKTDTTEVIHIELNIPKGKMIIPEWIQKLKWKSDEWRKSSR